MVEFYRKSKVTKDVPISEIFSDKYGGLETSATIRGGRFSEKYALEFQVPDDPSFGSGILHRLDLGLYTTGLELAENSTAIPKLVAFRVSDVSQSGAGREIAEGVGNKYSDDVLVYSSQLRDFSSVEEVFNGTTNSGPDEITYQPIQRTLFRKEKAYSTAKMIKKYGQMWGDVNNRVNDMGVDISYSEEKISSNYGSKPDDLGLNFGPSSSEQAITYTHTDYSMPQIDDPNDVSGRRLDPKAMTTDRINPSTPILILTKDNETKTKGGNASLYKVEPLENKSGNTLFIFDNQPGVYWGNTDVIDNETYGNEVTSANSIFEYVRGADEFIGENKKSEGETELFGVGAVRFSNKIQRTGGQSCQMYTFWKQQDDDPVSYARRQGSGPSDRQECLIAKKNIPLPTKFPARPNWDNQDENHFASTIEIDLYIESLEKAYVRTSGIQQDYAGGASSGLSYEPTNLITARRGIAICFSEDAPTSGQSFYDFVAHHGARNNTEDAASHYSLVTGAGVTGIEGSTNGDMWAVAPSDLGIGDDMSSNTSGARNFSGVLIVMTPEGPAVIPSVGDGTTQTGVGWLLDDRTKDVNVIESAVLKPDTEGGLNDLIGKWVTLTFKVTPDGWTCYGKGYSADAEEQHTERGIYKGNQHTLPSRNNSPSHSSHSILQIVDLGSDEIINDRTLYGGDHDTNNETDHYQIQNHYVAGVTGRGGGDHGGNSLQHWPKNLSIWLMNYKNDKDVGKFKDEYMDGPSSDTSSSIFIDSVRFTNFNFSVKNCSSKKYNPNASPIQIAPSSIWAGPDYPKLNSELTDGTTGSHKTNAPSVLSFGFKNLSDLHGATSNGAGDDQFSNFTSNERGVWMLFNGYETNNLGDNQEIPDCNIRFGYTGGYNGEIVGGATSSGSNYLEDAPRSGASMNDWFITDINASNSNLVNTDKIYDGTYLTIRGGMGKDQTRKIMSSNYYSASQYRFALQPLLANQGTNTGTGTKSYIAIHSHVFGNQFRNESIGAHTAPGGGEDSSGSYKKAMFTSRAYECHDGDLDDDDYWESAEWKFNDVHYNTSYVPSDSDTGFLHKAYHAYGTCPTAGGASTIYLQADMDNQTSAYNGCIIIIEGGTGAGQIREITGYTTSRIATVNKAWDTVPDTTSQYRLRIAPFVGGFSFRNTSSGNSNLYKWGGVSAGTHNNWVRKYSNSVTVHSTTGCPHGRYTDLQGGDNNDARFESKWFDTGLMHDGGAQVGAGNAITLKPHAYQISSTQRKLNDGSSDTYFPIRLNDTISIGSVGQIGQHEIPVTEMTSGSLAGTSATLVCESSTTITAASKTAIDRPVYTKLPTSINNFNRKGFAHFIIDNEELTNQPFKRENLATSARLTEINHPNNSQIQFTVDNPNILASDDDEEYIVYMYGQMATMNDANEIATTSDKGDCYEASPYCATGLKIISRDVTAKTVTLLWDGKANNGDLICTYNNLPTLMISPYRYWLYVVIDCTDETGQKTLNARSYRSVCWMENNKNNMAGYLATGEALGNAYNHANVNGTLAARQNLGSTWNEFKFNDASVGGVEGAYINEWELTRMEKGSSLDCTTDYGYGAFNAENNIGGYVGKHIFYKNPNETQTENIMQLPFIVNKASIEPRQDLTLLLAWEDEALPHTLTLKARNPTDDSFDPTIYSVYWDDRPSAPKLTVKPDEEDAFVPTFTWESQDDDLWYGLLHIDNTNIPNQYHNMIGHIPLDEDTATTYGGIYFENGAGTKTASNEGTFVNTREGLAGWAKEFNGTSNYLQFTDATNFTTKPTNEMTIVIHAIPNAAQGDVAYLIAKTTETSTNTDYDVFIDTDEKVNATITPASGTTLALKSNTILPRDGETPICIIVTFDNNIKGGNMKLFLDGKLEDQTGLMDATGTANNLKTGQAINQGTGRFYVGCSANGTTEQKFYNGKIEEVVIYNKCLYPVIPREGKFKLIKPLREVENGSPISYQGRLFMKDYHNIRGKRTVEIASSSPVSFAKAGFRLS